MAATTAAGNSRLQRHPPDIQTLSTKQPAIATVVTAMRVRPEALVNMGASVTDRGNADKPEQGGTDNREPSAPASRNALIRPGRSKPTRADPRENLSEFGEHTYTDSD